MLYMLLLAMLKNTQLFILAINVISSYLGINRANSQKHMFDVAPPPSKKIFFHIHVPPDRINKSSPRITYV